MLQLLKPMIVPILISSSFYIFGFFVTAEALGLNEREIVIGIVAGLACGLTTLVATILQQMRTGLVASPSI